MKKFLLLTAFLFMLSGFHQTNAQELTSEEQVKSSEFAEDFEIQGEYLTPSDSRGFQVIAQGQGKFQVIGYPGGLPGNGWNRDMARFFGEGEIVKDAVNGDEFVVTGLKMNIPKRETPDIIFDEEQKALKLRIRKDGDKFILNFKGEKELLPIRRESPTLGMEPPEGAYVVFDGTNVDQFLDGAKINEENHTLWSDATTKPFEPNRPYRLHIEFMTSFMPTSQGQARSNSGVYIAQSYECQVLDSFGLEGENNECGGFYQASKPLVNMAFPPLTWQTYDFDFSPAQYENGQKVKNAQITVMHNGVLIHDHLELQDATPGCLPEADEPRGIYLQGHGNKVQYRNIWVEYK